MKKCGMQIEWSDGTISECGVEIAEEKNACYLHEKYLTKVEIYGGEEIYQSTPAHTDRQSLADRTSDARYMVRVVNRYTGEARDIHDEDTD